MAWVDCDYQLPRRVAVLVLRRWFFRSVVAQRAGVEGSFSRHLDAEGAERFAIRLGKLLEQLFPEDLSRCQVRSFQYDMAFDGLKVLVESPGLAEVAEGYMVPEFDDTTLCRVVKKAGA